MRTASWGLLLGACLPGVALADVLTIDCRVLTDAGKPVAGAEAYIVTRLAREGARSHTQADGRCRLTLDAPDARWVRVVALAPGLAVGGGSFDAEAPGELVIRLAEATTAHGAVLAEEHSLGAVVVDRRRPD